MENYYNYFDYFKVLSLLKQLKFVIRDRDDSNYYHLSVSNIKDGIENQFESFEELLDENSFDMIDDYSLAYGGLFLAGIEYPIMSFYLKENICAINMSQIDHSTCRVYCLDNKKFNRIFHGGIIEDADWKKVLRIFMERIQIIMEIDVKIQLSTMGLGTN